MPDDGVAVQLVAAPAETAVVAVSAYEWAALAADVSASGAETAAGVEELLNSLGKRLAEISGELEVRTRDVGFAEEDFAAQAERLARVDEQIGVFRQARVEALVKVEALTKMQANEVKAISNRPPRIVRRATEAIYAVLNCGRWKDSGCATLDVTKEWKRIQQMLSKKDFVQSVLSFDVAALDAAPHVAEFVAERYFPSLQLQHDPSAPWLSPPDSPKAPLRLGPHSGDVGALASDADDSTAAASLAPEARATPLASPTPIAQLLDEAVATLAAACAAQAAPESPIRGETSPLSTGSASAVLWRRPGSSARASMRRAAPPPLKLHEAMASLSGDPSRGSAASSAAVPGSGPASSRPLSQRNATPASAAVARLIAGQGAGASRPLQSSSRKGAVMYQNIPSIIGGSAAQAASLSARTSRQPSKARNSVSAVAAQAAQEMPLEPLDVAAVEYASRACGALALWASEVLREFFALRQLRLTREKWKACVEACSAKQLEILENIKRLNEEYAALVAAGESWRRRLADLRLRELEAENALAGLAKLAQLEERRPLSRSGRRVAMVAVRRPSFGKCNCLNTSVSAVSLAKSPCHADEECSTPPPMVSSTRRLGHGGGGPSNGGRRKYLHCMSSPVLGPADD